MPSSYAETCARVGSWCVERVAGSFPAELRRPLALPKLASNERCPTTSGVLYRNDQFAGIALGSPPVQPLIATSRAGQAKRGVLRMRRAEQRGWCGIKTLWFSRPDYDGPVLIRARRLNGFGRIAFGGGPALRDPQLPPGPTLNGRNGFREWPGGTYIRRAGCYGWQVDGETFSQVIVFRAVLP